MEAARLERALGENADLRRQLAKAKEELQELRDSLDDCDLQTFNQLRHARQLRFELMEQVLVDNERLREAAELVCVTMEERGYGDMISFVELRTALAEKG